MSAPQKEAAGGGGPGARRTCARDRLGGQLVHGGADDLHDRVGVVFGQDERQVVHERRRRLAQERVRREQPCRADGGAPVWTQPSCDEDPPAVSRSASALSDRGKTIPCTAARTAAGRTPLSSRPMY